MEYIIYFADTETTSLDYIAGDIIELSLIRLTDNIQKTWFMKPMNIDAISVDALRVNGHKIEDLKGETKYGKETYQDPMKAIIEIENWIAEDDMPAEQRVLCGHNIAGFDKPALEAFWKKCGSADTFPFGRRTMDTMIWAFMMDYAQESFAESYSLSSLIKRFNIKNAKAHTASADALATKELFLAQVAELRKKLKC